VNEPGYKDRIDEMNDLSNSLSEMTKLLEERLVLVGRLTESLEASRWLLGKNDAAAIARGAAHQAELCRQWGRLEEQLRAESLKIKSCSSTQGSCLTETSAEVAAKWEALSARLRYLTRVHGSLLRHMQRSLGVLNGIINRTAPTYSAAIVAKMSPLPVATGV
jgi:hypothetical protein